MIRSKPEGSAPKPATTLCLSVRHPWAYAIAHLHNDVENRERSDGAMPSMCSHRGPLLIHASASCRSLEYVNAVRHMKKQNLIPAGKMVPALQGLTMGAILCVVEVIAHIDPMGFIWRNVKDPDSVGRTFSRWYMSGQWGMLFDPTKTELLPAPIPYKGSQGLYHVPSSVVDLGL